VKHFDRAKALVREWEHDWPDNIDVADVAIDSLISRIGDAFVEVAQAELFEAALIRGKKE